MLLGAKIKQPGEVLDYDFIYTEWFGTSPDFLASVAVEATPGDLGVTAIVADPNTVKVWVSGGTDGAEYSVEVTVTTDTGRIKQDELIIICQEF